MAIPIRNRRPGPYLEPRPYEQGIATTYTIRITLAHELTPGQFNEIALDMANEVWD